MIFPWTHKQLNHLSIFTKSIFLSLVPVSCFQDLCGLTYCNNLTFCIWWMTSTSPVQMDIIHGFDSYCQIHFLSFYFYSLDMYLLVLYKLLSGCIEYKALITESTDLSNQLQIIMLLVQRWLCVYFFTSLPCLLSSAPFRLHAILMNLKKKSFSGLSIWKKMKKKKKH